MQAAELTTMPHVMPEHKRGRDARQLILDELARRWQEFDIPPTLDELGGLLTLSQTAVRFHVARLRRDGDVNPAALWITRAGFEKTGGSKPLTN